MLTLKRWREGERKKESERVSLTERERSTFQPERNTTQTITSTNNAQQMS